MLRTLLILLLGVFLVISISFANRRLRPWLWDRVSGPIRNAQQALRSLAAFQLAALLILTIMILAVRMLVLSLLGFLGYWP